ncbi:glycosyltransferase [Mannheimia indoligenes]|uniref:glycosyltransferase n=1 Tax=Mannheimia indoligenes TaxID=3103145 RepID=UPI002FE68A40
MLTGLGMGGAERQVCDLADELVSLGHNVKLVSLNSKNEAIIFPKNKEIIVEFLNMSKTPFGLFNAIFQLKKLIKNFQPDVVHCHMFHANIVGRLSRLFVKFPKLICTAHNTNEGSDIRMLAYRYTNFLSDINTNVSEEAVEAFIKRQAVKKEQMFAMPNGIDTQRFQKNELSRQSLRNEFGVNDSFVFLAVGRLEEQKDYPNLLNAFHIVNQHSPNTKLVIVGTGSLEAELKQLVQQLGIASNVLFVGLRKDIPEIMNIADTYVLSSKYEGLPLVLGESMATENIIVATDCGGTKEMMGRNGFLVIPQDHYALAEAMQKSMQLTEQEKQHMGRKAREYIISNYSLNEVAKKWVELYARK